jgi:hypothetical protein
MVILGVGTSCQTAPYYRVDSYEQLKEDLAGEPDIIFPDLSRFELYDGLVFDVYYCGYEYDKSGYDIHLGEYWLEQQSLYHSCIDGFGVACSDLNRDYDNDGDSSDTADDYIKVNHEYRGMPMEYNSHFADEHKEHSPWPEGAVVGGVAYNFQLDGYRYYVNMGFQVPPDKLDTESPEAWMAKIESQTLSIVDNILDQAGVPR